MKTKVSIFEVKVSVSLWNSTFLPWIFSLVHNFSKIQISHSQTSMTKSRTPNSCSQKVCGKTPRTPRSIWSKLCYKLNVENVCRWIKCCRILGCKTFQRGKGAGRWRNSWTHDFWRMRVTMNGGWSTQSWISWRLKTDEWFIEKSKSIWWFCSKYDVSCFFPKTDLSSTTMQYLWIMELAVNFKRRPCLLTGYRTCYRTWYRSYFNYIFHQNTIYIYIFNISKVLGHCFPSHVFQ